MSEYKNKVTRTQPENGAVELPSAVATHALGNSGSNHNNMINPKEDNKMKKQQKKDIKALLSEVAIKPGDVPKIKFDQKRTVIKASNSLPKNIFFRAHQDHEMEFMMVQAGKGMDSRMYIIGPGVTMPAHLNESTIPVACHLIVFADGELRILERKTAQPGEPLNEYQQSSLNVVRAAQKGWVIRQWNKSAGVFNHVEADGDYAPGPSWPEDDFMELLTEAYEGRIIDSVNHPVYMELAGKKAIIDAD